MKKATLLAATLASLASVSSGAMAQQTSTDTKTLNDQIQIYGDLDVGVGRFKLPGATSDNKVESGLFAPSYLGFGGRSDISPGVRAVFALETYIGLDTGADVNAFQPDDPFWGRSAYVGVESDYGTLTLGRNKNPFYYEATGNNAFGESYFSPALSVAAFRLGHVIGRAHDNSVRYTSPTVAGFTAAALWAPKEDKSNGDDMSATLNYTRGSLVVLLGMAQAKSGLTEGSKSAIRVGGLNYDFGVVRLFVEGATQKDTEVQVKSKAWDVGATAPLGNFTVRASFARIRQTDLQGGNAATYRVAALGTDYALSPRVSLYAAVKKEKVHVDATDADLPGQSMATGMRLRF